MAAYILEKPLGENRLRGPNYVDWKRNLNIFLTAEKPVHVLNEEPPESPPDDAAQDVKVADELWFDRDSLAKCYILASLDDWLQGRHQSFATSRSIMASLKEIFRIQICSARQSALEDVSSAKMVEGTRVIDHVMKMVGCMNQLETLGAKMDNGLKTDVVLSSLPDSFDRFVLKFNSSDLKVTPHELCDMLQKTEGTIKKDEFVLMLSEYGQFSNSSKRRRNFGN